MDSTPQTSFIPKKPISSGSASYEERGVSIITIICVIVFFGSVALAVGSYLYSGILKTSLENKKATLEKAKQGFELGTIEDLKRLDTRIETVKRLLQNHISFSTYFSLLEEATLISVRFSDLTITSSLQGITSSATAPLDSSSGALQFKMRGVAKSYSSVALQSKVFTDSKKFKEPIVSDLSLDQSGNVNFNVSAKIDPSSLLYKDTLGLPPSSSSTNNGGGATSTQSN